MELQNHETWQKEQEKKSKHNNTRRRFSQ